MSDATRILVVDDEAAMAELVRSYLVREGMEVLVSGDGLAALELARLREPDVIVLDVMLPGLDGFEVCRRLRAFSDAYVIMLTARTEEIDRVVGLSVGADDYLAKPFSPRELVARVRALLRRPRTAARADDRPWEQGGLAVDPRRRTATLRGRPVALTAIEFEILATLIREPGVVVTRQQLLDRVWGADFFGDEHVVDVHIANLRRKLGDEASRPTFVETVRGVGFRLRGAR